MIGDEQVRQALHDHAGNVTHAAKVLGLTRETLSRWLTDDPGLRTTRGPKLKKQTSGRPPSRRSSFGAWVLRMFELTPAEVEILQMAEAARTIARDKHRSDSARLAAMREFRNLVRELDLPEVVADGEAEVAKTTVRPFPRRVG